MQEHQNTDRMVYIDILRIIACFLVIANHTNYVFASVASDYAHASWFQIISSTIYQALVPCAVTVFLMLSGCLMLQKQDSYKKALAKVLRFLMVLVIFSVPYYFIGDFDHSLYNFYLVVGRAQVTTAYWYLYLYLGVLVMMPILQRMVRHFKKEDYLYFLIFSVFLCTFSFVTEFNVNFKLPIFSTFLGMVVLGSYLDTYITCKKKYVLPLAGLILVIILFLTAFTIYRLQAGSDYAPSLLHYENIFYITISASLFLIMKTIFSEKEIAPTKKQWITRIGKDTFGIYLVSDFLIHYIEPVFSQFNNIFAVIVLDVIVFLLGLLVTEIIRKIPFLGRLIS